MSDEHTFTYHGVELPIFYHMYNLTHLNERCVEVAIAHAWLEGKHPKNGMEVGNVLGHYAPRPHNVLDKFEVPAWYQLVMGQDVVNADIFQITPMPGSEWVVSISTIEHTEDPIKAIEILRELVAPGGQLLVTFPMGEREELDRMVLWEDRWRDFFDIGCTIVRDAGSSWYQTETMQWRPYGPWANSVFVGEWTAPV